ncbi:zerumbone synthase [Cryptomeria japonica]|uniref:zerumbone synthase n=1 Tax=Cryptomeria japonica TaxID=3369 RepID=UPI0025ACB7B5|nr:zerumbone synthase [Cryptomeria japonica]
MFRKQFVNRLYNVGAATCHEFVRLFSTQPGQRLEGKVALITGAASGIGKATATEFAQNGAKVIIADIQDEVGKEAARQLGPTADFIHCDVTQESHVAEAVAYAVSKHGHLDIMYNNAGVPGPIVASIADVDLSDLDYVMKINVRGAIIGMKHAARAMVPRKQGCILCTASIAGLIGGVAPHPYSISKFAIPGLVKSVASELSQHGIRVNCISPYAIATPFALEGLRQLFPQTSEEELAMFLDYCGEMKGVRCEVKDIARAALYLASDDGRYITGHNLVVDGGFSVMKSFRLPT